MTQICALVPDFYPTGGAPATASATREHANKYYDRLRRAKLFKIMVAEAKTRGAAVDHLPHMVDVSPRAYKCTYQPSVGEIDLLRPNPMQVLHIVAHYLQPGEGPWHGGEFGSIFLKLIERMHGPDIRRAAKDIMIANNVKTAVRSEKTREAQSARFYERKAAETPDKLLRLLGKMKERGGDG